MANKVNEGKNLTEGQKIAAEIVGEVAGLGAGGVIGGLVMAAVAAGPFGKVMKVLGMIGAIGITWTVQDKVADGTKEAMGDIFEGMNSLSEIASAMTKGVGEEPEKLEAENE